MTYENYLKCRNLSNETIRVYLINLKIWNDFIKKNKIDKELFVKFMNYYAQYHKPNSVHLMYCSLLSFFKFMKWYKLINECRDIRLPKQQPEYKETITINDFNNVLENYFPQNFIRRRNWLIFCVLFMTGIRVNELNEFKISKIKNEKIYIKCKGSKYRSIYLNDKLMYLLKSWPYDEININKNNKKLSNKQIIYIIKELGKQFFNKQITPHSLRRSFATNLLRANIDIKIVSELLGHSNINTTARYIHYTEQEIKNEFKKLF